MLEVTVVLLVAVVVGMLWQRRLLIGLLTYGRQAQEGHLRVGDLAPDVTLVALGERRPVTLSSYWKKRPVVLIFGSFT